MDIYHVDETRVRRNPHRAARDRPLLSEEEKQELLNQQDAEDEYDEDYQSGEETETDITEDDTEAEEERKGPAE
jgi:hypothetical protein